MSIMIHSPSDLPSQSYADLNAPTNQPRPQATRKLIIRPLQEKGGNLHFKK